jgi:hypothetical protein
MFNFFAHLEVPVPPYLIQLLSIDSKAALEKYSRTIEITGHDFAILVGNAASLGYHHAIQHHEFRPEHLEPTKADLDALRNKNPQRFVRKINQIFKDRRLLVSHLFHNSSRWHLFYFDQRDTQEDRRNRWKRGSHIHVVNDLWPRYDPHKLWDIFSRADASAGSKLHIPFKRTRYGSGEA